MSALQLVPLSQAPNHRTDGLLTPASSGGHTLPARCALYVTNGSWRSRRLNFLYPEGKGGPVSYRVRRHQTVMVGPFARPAGSAGAALLDLDDEIRVTCPRATRKLRILAVDATC